MNKEYQYINGKMTPADLKVYKSLIKQTHRIKKKLKYIKHYQIPKIYDALLIKHDEAVAKYNELLSKYNG